MTRDEPAQWSDLVYVENTKLLIGYYSVVT